MSLEAGGMAAVSGANWEIASSFKNESLSQQYF